MALTATQITFLQRLIQEGADKRRAGEAARYFVEHYNVGRALGAWIVYDDQDRRRAAALLRGLDVPVTPLGPGAQRADVADYGGLSEKMLSVAPHADSIAIRAVGACGLDGDPFRTLPGCYTVIRKAVAERIQCDVLLVVENLETFRAIEDYRWLDFQGRATLVVFRGDPRLDVGEALGLVRSRAEPIWAFVDFDPAGLGIANALPHERLERLMLPPAEWLQRASGTRRGRELFDRQLAGHGANLDGSGHEQVRAWWLRMKAWRSGVTQEAMRDAPGVSSS